MFRFNNPDALLVLLLTLGARISRSGDRRRRLRWVLWAGAMIGLGFLTKQLQAFLSCRRRAGVTSGRRRGTGPTDAARIGRARRGGGLCRLVGGDRRAGSGSHAALRGRIADQLVPGADIRIQRFRSADRFRGRQRGWPSPGGVGATPVSFRLFARHGGQIAWLLPAALVLAMVGFVLSARAAHSARRATLTLFAGWMLVTGVAFSFMAGIFHAYYTVALAPAIAAVVAIGPPFCGRAEPHPRPHRAGHARAGHGGLGVGAAVGGPHLAAGAQGVVAILRSIAAGMLLLCRRAAAAVGGHGAVALAAVLLAPRRTPSRPSRRRTAARS